MIKRNMPVREMLLGIYILFSFQYDVYMVIVPYSGSAAAAITVAHGKEDY